MNVGAIVFAYTINLSEGHMVHVHTEQMSRTFLLEMHSVSWHALAWCARSVPKFENPLFTESLFQEL